MYVVREVVLLGSFAAERVAFKALRAAGRFIVSADDLVAIETTVEVILLSVPRITFCVEGRAGNYARGTVQALLCLLLFCSFLIVAVIRLLLLLLFWKCSNDFGLLLVQRPGQRDLFGRSSAGLSGRGIDMSLVTACARACWPCVQQELSHTIDIVHLVVVDDDLSSPGRF